MKDSDCVKFLRRALPPLWMRWPGFRKIRKQVCKRIDRPLRELGLADVEAYRDYLEAHGEEWSVLDSFCRIPISGLYGDRGVFDYLRDEVLPILAATAQTSGDDNVRCWSAGCASGEEVYALNIIWKLCAGSRFPDVSLRVIAQLEEFGRRMGELSKKRRADSVALRVRNRSPDFSGHDERPCERLGHAKTAARLGAYKYIEGASRLDAAWLL